MSNSLRDQLLKAGLVSEEQAKKAKQPKNKPKTTRGHSSGKKRPLNKKAGTKPQKDKENNNKKPAPNDLAKFYAERAKVERSEREAEEKRQRELAARRKKVRAEIRNLVKENLQNVDDADIRYNFVVGNNIKYLYVNDQQQDALAAGELAITFQEGKRCLIPITVAKQIQELDPEKIIIINTSDNTEVESAKPAPTED